MFKSSSLPLSERLRDRLHAVRHAFWEWRFRLRFLLKRCRRAFHYALDTLSDEDAREILYDCHEIAGYHPLITLSVDDTFEQALQDYHDHPQLRGFVVDACAYVGRKWECGGDYLYEAQRWAVEKAAEYAADDGVALRVRDAGESLATAEDDQP